MSCRYEAQTVLRFKSDGEVSTTPIPPRRLGSNQHSSGSLCSSHGLSSRQNSGHLHSKGSLNHSGSVYRKQNELLQARTGAGRIGRMHRGEVASRATMERARTNSDQNAVKPSSAKSGSAPSSRGRSSGQQRSGRSTGCELHWCSEPAAVDMDDGSMRKLPEAVADEEEAMRKALETASAASRDALKSRVKTPVALRPLQVVSFMPQPATTSKYEQVPEGSPDCGHHNIAARRAIRDLHPHGATPMLTRGVSMYDGAKPAGPKPAQSMKCWGAPAAAAVTATKEEKFAKRS
eukprot:6197949-Pleurochrysis_carterae.AAC.1